MPIQICRQSVSTPRGKEGAKLIAHTEWRAKRQRSAREAIDRNKPIAAPYQEALATAGRLHPQHAPAVDEDPLRGEVTLHVHRGQQQRVRWNPGGAAQKRARRLEQLPKQYRLHQF